MAGAYSGVLDSSYGASGAVTKQRFVKTSGDETVIQASVAGEFVIGVAETSISTSEATNGKATAVNELGIAWVVWGGGTAMAVGDEIATDNVGRAVKAVATNVVAGRCRMATTGKAAGDLILVALGKSGYIKP